MEGGKGGCSEEPILPETDITHVNGISRGQKNGAQLVEFYGGVLRHRNRKVSAKRTCAFKFGPTWLEERPTHFIRAAFKDTLSVR